MADLARSFVDSLAEGARERFGADLGETLAVHLAAAHEAWPAITVAPERFAGELARRLGPDADQERLAAVCARDVYLAIACADGDEAAIAEVERGALREVDAAGGKLRATGDQTAEVKARLRHTLFVDEPHRPSAIREFSGRGDLRAYIRVMATRDLIRAINKGKRETPLANDDVLDRLALHEDPELSILRAQYREHVTEAMRAALGGLDERSQALLRYQLVERWTVDQVGAVYGVSRATAARWTAAAREKLGELIQAELAARLEIVEDEVASIVRLVQSRVDVSLERVLASPRS